MMDQILTFTVCLGAPLILITIIAILGTKSRLKMAEHILQGIEEGRFRDLSTPQNAKRIRRITIAQLAILGAILICMILFLSNYLSTFSAVVIYIILLVVGIIVSRAMFREILSRL